ncbi:hypothetical protein [Sphingomonas sp.]|uniref:hypothetical protein n=1 Tax=Sphingomonas sp. TaxID=28214 RepID=UPI0035C80A97
MSLNVVPLPTQATAEAAWDRYAALVKETAEDPSLLLNRTHVEATILAHEIFRRAFIARGDQ